MSRSRDQYPEGRSAERAAAALERSRKLGWRAILDAHEAAWNARWTASDVVIEGDEAIQKALRFAVYHLTSAANPEDEYVSIGARGLTGDAYFGHVFWDTEIYLLPFYIAVCRRRRGRCSCIGFTPCQRRAQKRPAPAIRERFMPGNRPIRVKRRRRSIRLRPTALSLTF